MVTYAKYFDTVVDKATGQPRQGATVTVTDGSGAAVQLYSDAGITPIENPINSVTTDVNGLFQFYVANGTYTLKYQYAGADPVTVTGVPIYEVKVVDALGTSTSDAPSQNAVSTAVNAIVVDSFGTSTTNAPSQNAFNQTTAAAKIKASDGNTVQDNLDQRKSASNFGAAGDGTDQTTALQSAMTSLASSKKALLLASGSYLASVSLGTRSIAFAGEGMTSTVISPTSADGVAFRDTAYDASQLRSALSDAAFVGTGTRQGVGFRFGDNAHVTNAEYAGRRIFERVRFENFNSGLERPFGNIGVDLNQCVFASNNYHVWAHYNVTGDPMHAGCQRSRGCEWTGAQKAAVYINSQTVGSGQIVFDGEVFEANPGWVFYIDGFFSQDGQPSIVVRSCWNEANYTASSVDVEGDVSAPGYAKLINVNNMLFEDTPIGPLVLETSHVTTRDCDLSKLTTLSIDASSTLTHWGARLYSGTAPGLTMNIGAVANASALSSPFFRMRRPVGLGNPSTTVVVNNAQTPISFTGTYSTTTTPSNSPGLPGLLYSQDLTINAGATLLPPFADIPAGWLVVQLLVKLVSGTACSARLNGSSGLGGSATIDNSEWRTITGIIQNTGSTIAGNSLWFSGPASGASVIRIGGYALSSFATAQEALAYANSGLFPIEARPAYTITNGTPARTLNADTTLPTAAAAYSQADTQTLTDAVKTLQRVLATLVQDEQKGQLPA